MSRYAKALTAFFTALGTWGYTALAADEHGEQSITGAEWFGLCAVVVATLAVWAVPNDSPPGEPSDPSMSERGHADMTTLIVMAAVAIVVCFALLFAFDLI